METELISIHAPRVGSDGALRDCISCTITISIHAPRVGSDDLGVNVHHAPDVISIHAPRVGSDRPRRRHHHLSGPISIHAPRVGSDGKSALWQPVAIYFYPRSPRGERPYLADYFYINKADFYPRSPRGERPTSWRRNTPNKRFLSTLPAWGATNTHASGSPSQQISIHAPRVGSDSVMCSLCL